MSLTRPSLGAYHVALLDYVERNDEKGLAHAYELGRTGFDSGCELLHMLDVHEKALGMILAATPLDLEVRRRIDASARFLCEALSPFGMATAGYRALVKPR